MSDKKHPLRVLAESGPLIAVAVAIAMLVAVVMPASAQFFPFGFGQRPQQRQQQPYQQQQPFQQRGFGDFFAPFQGDQPQAPRVDYSRAPPPKADKGDAAPERHVLVLGDAMADWLAYGLEDAFSEQPDMGVIRKHRTVSGLIRYQPRGEPSEWAAAAKGIVAQEKADVIVVMLGLHDRTTIREPVAEKPDPKKDDRRKADSKAGAKQETAPNTAKKPDRGRRGAACGRSGRLERHAVDRSSRAHPARRQRVERVSFGTLDRTLQEEDRRHDRRAQDQGRSGAVGRPAGAARAEGDVRHAVSGFALPRERVEGRHHLCGRLGRLRRRGRPLHAARS